MKKLSLVLSLIALSMHLQGQETRQKVEAGNKAFAEGAYDQAEINYREAFKEGEKHRSTLNFNLGDALHKQERFEEAQKAFEMSLAEAKTKLQKAEAYHNLANNYLKQEKLAEAIQNYKQSLINNPLDEETRYNLAKALQQQKQEQQQQQQQQQDQNQDQDKDKEDQKDQQDKQDQQDQKDKEDQQDQKDQQDQQNNQDQKQDQKPSPEQEQKDMNRKNAERLLQALDRDEEKLQKELLKKKIKAKPLKSVKDW